MTREKIISLASECGVWLNDDINMSHHAPRLEAFYHAAIADFLKESGQYLTNDASREACIKQAKSEAFEAAAKLFDGCFNPLVSERIREMAKEMK